MADKKDEDKDLKPLPILLNSPSVAPPPPSEKALFRIRVAPSLARHPVPTND